MKTKTNTTTIPNKLTTEIELGSRNDVNEPVQTGRGTELDALLAKHCKERNICHRILDAFERLEQAEDWMSWPVPAGDTQDGFRSKVKNFLTMHGYGKYSKIVREHPEHNDQIIIHTLQDRRPDDGDLCF